MHFTKEQLESVLSAASKDSTRYNINCVRVEPFQLVATDGHRMYCVKTADAESGEIDEPVLLPVTDAKRILRSLSKGERCTLYRDGESWVARGAFGMALEFKALEAEYPDYTLVWPKESPEVELGFNAQYLMELCRAAIKADKNSERRTVTLKLSIRDGLSSVKFETGGDFSGILMPMRLE